MKIYNNINCRNTFETKLIRPLNRNLFFRCCPSWTQSPAMSVDLLQSLNSLAGKLSPGSVLKARPWPWPWQLGKELGTIIVLLIAFYSIWYLLKILTIKMVFVANLPVQQKRVLPLRKKTELFQGKSSSWLYHFTGKNYFSQKQLYL